MKYLLILFLLLNTLPALACQPLRQSYLYTLYPNKIYFNTLKYKVTIGKKTSPGLYYAVIQDLQSQKISSGIDVFEKRCNLVGIYIPVTIYDIDLKQNITLQYDCIGTLKTSGRLITGTCNFSATALGLYFAETVNFTGQLIK